MKLIFAQGNPEPDYALSRHNVGFLVLNTLASKLGAQWSEKPKFAAFVAETTLAGEKVLLVKPTTYYNETGVSARKLIDFYKLDPMADLLVIHDDLALPFGTLRVREKGSDAGNNGIKSLNAHVGTTYARIRIGTWNERRDHMDDAAFVLARFTPEESNQLKENIAPYTIELIEAFCQGALKVTSHSLEDFKQ